MHQFFYPVKVLLEVGNEDRPLQDRVGDGLGNFRFSTSRYGARFVAEHSLRNRANQSPVARARHSLHMHLVAGRPDIGFTLQELDRLGASILRPGDGLLVQIEVHVLGNIDDVWIEEIHGIAFRFNVHEAPVHLHHLGERMVEPTYMEVAAELLTEVVAGIDHRPARVFLLAQAEQVCGEAYLSLYLLLAVAEIVVGNQGDHAARTVAAGDLEGGSIVIELVGLVPKLAVADLPRCGLAAWKHP